MKKLMIKFAAIILTILCLAPMQEGSSLAEETLIRFNGKCTEVFKDNHIFDSTDL